MTQRDPSMKESWAERLLESMDADEHSGDGQPEATIDDLHQSGPLLFSIFFALAEILLLCRAGHATPRSV